MTNFTNWDQVESALQTVRQDKSGGWVCCVFSDADQKAPKTVTFKAQGDGGSAALREHFKDDQFAYALIRLADEKHKLEHTHATTFRDIFIHFHGPDTAILKRGKLTEHLGAVEKKFEPNHAQICVKDKTVMTDALLLERSAPGSGSHIIE